MCHTSTAQPLLQIQMKLFVRQFSGLGNQMFQYAAGLYYARRHNAQMLLVVDPPRLSYDRDPRPFLLSRFAISAG
jgi:hypothetical protein